MISIQVFDPKDYNIYVWGAKYTEGNNFDLHNVEEWAKITGADWVFNLAFFNNAQKDKLKNCFGRTLQYVSNPALGDLGYDDIDGGRTPLITLNSGSKFRGYGKIIVDGKIQPGLYYNITARNMNGLTADGRYIHVTASATTEYLVAANVISRIKKQYGTTVKYLFREDGGGSASMYSSISRLGYWPQGVRAIPTVVCVKRKVPYTFTRTIMQGVNGVDSAVLQQMLGGIEVDGIFGRNSVARLKQAQRALGIPADGAFGPQSAGAMGCIFIK